MADDIKFVIGVDDRDLIKAQKEQIKFQRNLVTIEKAYRKGDITASRYNAELAKQAKQLQTLGGSYRSASSEIRTFAYQLRQADDATLAQTEAMAFAGKRVNRLGVGLQQAGYQVGDFAVQLQGGTNAAVALGQQGSQLLGIFGPAGAIAGAALAITTAIVAPLIKANEEAENLLDKVAESTEKYQTKLDMLKFGVDTEQQAKALQDLFELEKTNRTLRQQMQQTDSLTTRQRLSEELKDNKLLLATTRDIVEENRRKREQYELSVKLSGSEVQEAENERQARRLINEAEKKAAAESLEAQRKIAEQERIVGAALNDSLGVLKYMKAGFKAAEIQALKLSGVDLTANISSGAQAAVTLARNLGISYETAVKLRELEATGDSGRGAGYEALSQELQLRNATGMGFVEDKGKPKTTSGGGGPKKLDPAEQIEKFMSQLEQANSVQRERILLGEESARVTELVNKYKEAGIPLDMKRIQNLAREEQELQKLENAHASLTDALMSVVDGTQSVGDAFKGLLRQMILDIYREKVAKSFATNVLGFLGFANGGVFSNGSQVNAFADGGVVGGPTYFPMSGGQTGLMGEAGPEAIMPLKRGADGKLGVQMNGGGEQVVVNQNINISTGVQQTVRNEIKSMMPQIAAQSKSAVLDAKRRGGAYGGKF
jgi:hypothetical protein